MLYVTEILVSHKDKKDWGIVLNKTVNLPSKIHKIKSVCFFAELQHEFDDNGNLTSAFVPDRFIKRIWTPEGAMTPNIEWFDFYSATIGTVSITINKTNCIIANSPLYAINTTKDISGGKESDINLRYDGTYKNNKVELPEVVKLCGGEPLTIIVEEKDVAPNQKESGVHPLAKGGYYSNAYKIKVYIEYDR